MTPTEKQNLVIRKLLLKQCVKANTVPKDVVAGWFSESAEGIEDTIDTMVADSDIPVTTYGPQQEVRLIGVISAVEYLDSNGGEVPPSLEKYRNSPR